MEFEDLNSASILLSNSNFIIIDIEFLRWKRGYR